MGYTHYCYYKKKAVVSHPEFVKVMNYLKEVIGKFKVDEDADEFVRYFVHDWIPYIWIHGGCETFIFPDQEDEEDEFHCTKTRQFRYDTYVVACHYIIRHFMPDVFKWSSDGCADELEEGYDLACEVLGEKIRNEVREAEEKDMVVNADC